MGWGIGHVLQQTESGMGVFIFSRYSIAISHNSA